MSNNGTVEEQKRKEFVELVNEYINASINSPEDVSPWSSDDPRWEAILDYAKSRFIKRFASNFSYYLSANLDEAVNELLYNFFMALQGLRRNTHKKTSKANYSYPVIVRAVVNNLINEIRDSRFKQYSKDESIETKVETGSEPSCEQFDEDYFMRCALISAFIRTTSDLTRGIEDSISLTYDRIFLAKFIIEVIKSIPDMQAFSDASYITAHERELIEQLEQRFVPFCMLDQKAVYDSFAAIHASELGKYHDMTSEEEDFKPYSDYPLDNQIEVPIIHSVISSYLYSIGIRGSDGVRAVATNTVSSNFRKTCERLGMELRDEHDCIN